MNILEVKELKKIYYGEYQLDNISFQLNAGEALAVLGAECAGKTPLLECITGRKWADSGNVFFMEKDTAAMTSKDWKDVVFLPADIIYYEHRTVQRLFQRTISFYGSGGMDRALEYCEKYEIPVKTELLSLTPQQNRCVSIINALLTEPKLLVIDEPYYCLTEPVYLKLLEDIDLLRQRGTAVLYACEEYEQISGYCDFYMLLREGDCTAYGKISKEDVPTHMVSVMTGGVILPEPEKSRLFDACRGISWQHEVQVFGDKICFPYKGDMTELSRMLCEFRCRQYQVEQMTLEEEVLHSYERWSE